MKLNANPKQYFLLLFFFTSCLLVGCADDEGPEVVEIEEEVDPVDNLTWNLVFEEEFDNNLDQWDIWFGGAFNEEIQLYRPEQLSVSDGMLTIDVQKEQVRGPTNNFNNSPKSFQYVSGRIESKEHFGPSATEGAQQFRFMASIKLPAGHGMWPAFWTYGDPWPTQGEIDVLEARGGEPTIFQSNLFYGPVAGVNINQGAEVEYETGVDLTAEFHTYEMIWKQNSIEIIFDGQVLHTYTSNTGNNISSMFEKKQRVVLNTAVGGLFFPDTNTVNFADNAIMQVDWVRVYRR